MEVITLLNIKYKGIPIKKGSKVEIEVKEVEEFVSKGIIDDEYLQSVAQDEIMPNAEKDEPTKSPTKEEKEVLDTMGIESYTKAEIGEILSQKGITYSAKDSKRKLYGLLTEGD